jgi:antitoxin (DNA-binding transcriptional repressor) of toxin-antitoxin stability system
MKEGNGDTIYIRAQHLVMVLYMVEYKTMITLNLNLAKAHLSECIAQAEAGVTVVICKRNKPVAEFRAIPQPQLPIGLLEGQFSVPKAFFDLLPNEIIAAFEGRGG